MVAESVLWTVLPNGRREGRLHATVVISPRLTADPGRPFQSVRDFPAFTDWPGALAGLDWQVEVDGAGIFPAELDHSLAPASSATWGLVFADSVGVVDHSFVDHSTRIMRSFPADELAYDVLNIYAQIATAHPWDLPPVTTGPIASLAEEIGTIGDHFDRPDGPYDMLSRFFNDSSDITDRRGRYLVRGAVPGTLRRRVNYLQAYRFYDRFSHRQRVRTSEAMLDVNVVPPAPERPHHDFHAYVAALGDYPVLMRMLGLAIDLVMPDDLPSGTHRLRLMPAAAAEPWMTAEPGRPWMNYHLDDALFLARPRRRESGLHHGQLQLDVREWFAVHQIDIDGSVLKLAHLAATAHKLNDHLATTQPSMSADEITIPALRSAGLTVVRHDRAAGVVAQLDSSLVNEQATSSGQPADLFAEDVVRGYRVDVGAGGRFRPLYQRTGTYTVRTDHGVERIEVPPDEGYVKAASTTAVPDDDSEHYLHEALFSWGGWSQVVQRPGARLNPDEELEDQQAELDTDADLPLVTSFVVTRGTLPSQRYGIEYQFRARVADLAGNSINPALIGDDHATAPQVLCRWEPVPSPVVLPRRPYGEGESQLRMVIRSTADTTVASYLALPRVQQLPGHTDPETAYLSVNDRWLAAPKTSQQMAELHGVFDAAFGPGASQADREAAFEVSARESEVLPEQVPQDELTLPYLPDVSSRGVSFTRLPADPQSTRLQVWPVDDPSEPWWDRQPFRIRIEQGAAEAPVTPAGAPAPPIWDAAERILHVHLPQAELVRVRLSSHLDDEDLDIQGVWNLVDHVMDASDRAAAIRGLMWLITPPVTLTLVHAVEKPLADPRVSVPPSGMVRTAGETLCVLSGAIDNHAMSTGRIDVDAAWTEQVDDVAADAPLDGVDGRGLRHGHAHVGDFSLTEDEDHSLTGRDDVRPVPGQQAVHRLRHELGDTKHRLVGYTATATTRFREYFPAEVIDGVDDQGQRLITRIGPTTYRHVPSSRRPEPPDIAYVMPVFDWRTEKQGPAVTLPGRPPLPRPLVRTRIGGLRVYLRRPWFTSGDGELLGVVVADQPWLTWSLDLSAGLTVPLGARRAADLAAAAVLRRAAGRPGLRATPPRSGSEDLLDAIGVTDVHLDPASARQAMSAAAGGLAPLNDLLRGLLPLGSNSDTFVTRWGSDPIRDSAPPAGGPYIHQMPLRTAVGTKVSLAEYNQATVTVVGHTPQFDTARGLWFCDIQLDAGNSYLPFVRLGLCRFQPHAIDGAEISRIETTGFIQLVPRRTATFTPQLGAVRVEVRGPAGVTWAARRTFGPHLSGPGLMESHRLTAQLQLLAAGSDPDLGWQNAGPEIALPPSQATALADVEWAGGLAVPEGQRGQRRRIMVREFELHWADDDADEPLGRIRDRSDSMFHAHPPAGLTHLRERLVYADFFDLPRTP